jgi:hypothetical protein
MGVGRWLMRDAAFYSPAPVGPPPPTPANATNLSGLDLRGTQNVYQIITGVSAVNNTRTEGTEFDNRGTIALGSTVIQRFPDLILQARVGDVITFTIAISKANAADSEFVRTWVTYNAGSSYTEINAQNDNFATSFAFNYTIPEGTPNGNHALVFSLNFQSAPNPPGTTPGAEQSTFAYSLEIW